MGSEIKNQNYDASLYSYDTWPQGLSVKIRFMFKQRYEQPLNTAKKDHGRDVSEPVLLPFRVTSSLPLIIYAGCPPSICLTTGDYLIIRYVQS